MAVTRCHSSATLLNVLLFAIVGAKVGVTVGLPMLRTNTHRTHSRKRTGSPSARRQSRGFRKWQVAWLVAGLPLVLCAGISSSSRVRRLTEEDSGLTLELKPGDTFEIVLGGNPAAGYQWEARRLDYAVVRMLGDPMFAPHSSATGSGGEFVFRFQAVALGESRIRFNYQRSFEEGRAPLRSFECILVVSDTEH